MVLRKTTHVRPVRHTGSRVRRVDPKRVTQALGAVAQQAPTITGSLLTATALRQEVFARLTSSGGRPGLDAATIRPKVPMTPEDWTSLEQLAKAFAAKGVKTTPSQVASAIIHKHIAQRMHGRDDAGAL